MGNAEVTVNKGVSQGSCLSPIHFNLCTAEFHSLSNEHDSILFQYADDLFLVCYDKDFLLAEEKLEQKVNSLMEMGNIINLTFNPLSFKLRRRPLSALCNNTIKLKVDSANYLGRTISANNSSVQHIQKMISKSNTANMFLQMLTGCRFCV